MTQSESMRRVIFSVCLPKGIARRMEAYRRDQFTATEKKLSRSTFLERAVREYIERRERIGEDVRIDR